MLSMNVDKDGEAVPGEQCNTNGALFYHVGAICNVNWSTLYMYT